MLNKKIASEIAIGIVLLLAVAIGGIFWMQNQKSVISNQPSVINNQGTQEIQKQIQEGNGFAKNGIANPASVFCVDHGGKLEMQSDAAGNQTSYCVFENGSKCDEWKYFRGECNKNGSTNANVTACTMEAKQCDDGTYVSRTGPNCEFAQCPASQKTSQQSVNTVQTNPVQTDTKAAIVFTIKSQSGKLMSGVQCAVKADEGASRMIPEISKKTDQNGVCKFQDLDSSIPYLVRVYWTSDKSRVSDVSLSFIPAGTTITRIIVKPASM